MKKLFLFALVVLIVAASAVSGYLRSRNGIEPEIATATVSVGDVIQTIGATGTVEAVKTVDVGTQVSGVVKEMFADFNSIVRQGQLVAKIDPATIEAQIESQKANIESAQASLERLKITLEDALNKLRRARDLHQRNLLTTQDLEGAEVTVKSTEAQIKAQEAGIKQQRATLNQLEVNLGYTNIYAPINGIVINRKVDVGQTVVSNNMATSIFQIAEDLTRMQLRATVDESDVSMLRPGQIATFRVDGYPEREFRGTVSQVRLQPIVTQNVVTYTTIINVPNLDLQLKPGMTANLKIEVARRENVMRVPVGALRFRPTAEIFQALKLPVPSDLQQRNSLLALTSAAAEDTPADPANTGAGIAERGATTIDALFGPLTFTDTPGRVWAYIVDEKTKQTSLVMHRVRTGINDGTFAELIEAPGVQEGKELVTAVDIGQQLRPGMNPLMPNRGQMGGDHGGGHGGGGPH